ncbi:hypothetical protein MMAN_06510 [Mycobacterium mantenii]|uniref:Uncharacterized protein n=1 Tax=Mycobacterium mantenii TaxID=560555 RepID=A0A1X0FXA8_MYCNT|nr:hypothetical protein [Mycobacterium mantenii]MCV7242811.1 hypothetical protein [Mycobacterium mantenii]ORB06356.1 hypothetical protein BST30_10305 [Mycobacterium mantenii]BBY36517.1 hypothetical protein MMAN_06510 [Mycobacterium mantenii]
MTLKIQKVTQDPRDRSGLSFVMQFTRPLTPHERQTVPMFLSQLLPTEENGPDTVVIRKAREEWFTLAQHRQRWKALLADAEAQAEKYLAQDTSAEGLAAARADQTRRRLEAIDWDDDSET